MYVITAHITNNTTDHTVTNSKTQIIYLVSFQSIHRQNQREVLHYKFCCWQWLFCSIKQSPCTVSENSR